MKKADLKKLQEMMNDPTVKGKKLIDRVIWLNTIEPKFKVGEYYEVTDPGHRIYGVPVRNFHAEIKDIRYFHLDKVIQYTLVSKVKVGDKETEVTVYKDEQYLGTCRKVEDNINIIDGDTKQPIESIDI